ncbi:hypothetical protein [Shewanella surugensis]|uniref:DNA-binding protein n=1 Tax=Shewanella surugensis TaxID=212020 RepID=A0ABT0LJB0_9GAMM|nr:hypothetical protein [Shewanella surugensis]MCL1127545.1 hypothetical protein [Shewanella surugensis]
MASVNLSEASRLVSKSRTTIWKYINDGKLSIARDHRNRPFVDTSELIRVFGEIKQNKKKVNTKSEHKLTGDYHELITTINELKKTIEYLTLRLEHKPLETVTSNPVTEPIKGRPEDDPEWPKEVKTAGDITLRKNIRDKYR